MFCGDVQGEGLSYKSFMTIPVLDLTQANCLAMVVIDSIEIHHFDEIHESFNTILSPYITTITTTFMLEKRYLERQNYE